MQGEELSSLSSRLTEARQQAGLSQGQVAKLLNMHRPTISEIEAGRRKVSSDELVNFADLYDVDMEWLAGRVGIDSNIARNRLHLAARELAKLKTEDLNTVLELLKTMRTPKGEAE